MDQLRITFSQRIEQFNEAARLQTRRINYISLSRLIVLIATVYFLVLGLKNGEMVYYGISLLFMVGFLILVSLFNRHKDRREHFRQLILLNETELACLDHKFHSLPDGQEFADPSHPWAHDLDIFGNGSLYQYINRTSTVTGAENLAAMLTNEPADIEDIRTRQGIIEDLKPRIGFRQDFTARGHLVREEKGDFKGIIQWLEKPAYITRHGWLFYLALLISGVALTIFTAGFFNHLCFRFLLPLLVFNYTLLSPFFMRTNRYQASISRKHELLDGYSQLLRIISETDFRNPVMARGRQQAMEGMREVKRLSQLINIFDQRLNMLLGSIFNGFFLFDFIMMKLLENWKQQNRKQIMDWIGLTGRTDAMISLAGFAFNHPGFVVPELIETEKEMELKAMGHPLIPPGKRVVNDIRIEGEKVVIITGANMAGKSTFLRSLGINTILSYTGCPVCASQFRCRLTGLFSSMRTADSLRDEESYFLAEIKKLQQIVRRMETGQPLLILLDEVLKGTNTTDKKRGSAGLIKRFLNYPVLCFIATHDLSLGELEAEYPGQVVNYCFESYIRDQVLEFDYTVRKGIATNMNASFLMKQMGIMD